MIRLHWIALTLAIGTLALGCASAREASESRRLTAPVTVVRVTNQNWNDVRTYVVSGGQRIFLGVVTTNRSVEFDLPREAFGSGRSLVFVARPLGSRETYVSDETLVRPGDTIEWTIANTLSNSFVTVF